MNLQQIEDGTVMMELLPGELQALALACYEMSESATLLDGDHYNHLGVMFEAAALAAVLSEGRGAVGTTMNDLRKFAVQTAVLPVEEWSKSTAWYLTHHVEPNDPAPAGEKEADDARG